MPRDGSGNYTRPPGIAGVPNLTIESADWNLFVADVEQDLNTPRPIVAGGTGANSATQARINLQAERSMQVVTNYDSQVWEPGSFYSASSATSPPVAGHAFAGIVYGPDQNNLVIQARDLDDTAIPGLVYVREKKLGVWEPTGWKVDGEDRWVNTTGDTMSGDLTISKASPTLLLNKPAAGTPSNIIGQTNGLNRWSLQLGDVAAESGGNLGSDFSLYRIDDPSVTGTLALSISRGTGHIALAPVTATANVGIGTGVVAPVARLEITSPGSPPALQLTQAGSNADFMRFVSSAVPATNKWAIRIRDLVEGDFNLRDITANASRLYINAAGNVGMGSTAPLAALEVKRTGGGSLINALALTEASGSGDAVRIGFYSGGNQPHHITSVYYVANGWLLNLGYGGLNHLSINGGGIVSVNNIAAPALGGRLQVVGAAGTLAAAGLGQAIVRIDGGLTHELRIGCSAGGSNVYWLQGTQNNFGAMYPICLNPSGGNIGIGTLAPVAKLHIEGANSATPTYTNGDLTGATLYLSDTTNAGNSGGAILFSCAPYGAPAGVFAGIRALLQNGAGPSGDLVFQARATTGNVTERMRISGSGGTGFGGVGIGTGGTLTAFGLLSVRFGSGNWGIGIDNNPGAVSNQYLAFLSNATQVGNVSNNGTGVVYNTTSDRTRKEDDWAFDRARPIIDALAVRDFKWKDHDTRGVGLFAQDAVEVFSDAVSPPNEMQDVWMIDYSKFVPVLISDAQETHARLAAIEQQLGIASPRGHA